MSTNTSATSTDRIERSIHIKAPRSRVWRAIADAEEYGKWFGADLKGQTFAPGRQVTGQLTIAGYEHVVLEMLIERIEPEGLMSFRWHPYAIDPAVDFSGEERTLVTFTLKEVEDGTLLTVTETGFDKLPIGRRPIAFRMNSGGWEAQMKNIDRHVATR